MKRVWRTVLAKANTFTALVISLILSVSLGLSSAALASDTSNFQITINPGTLSIDIVDAGFVTVASPTVVFGALTFSFTCQTPGASGTFGTTTEQIYVSNPDAADNGWTASLAASATTDTWASAGTDFDFNDPSGARAGCGDGGDTDGFAGQMTVDPSGGTLAVGNCSSCTTANITLGGSTAFSEGVTDSVTLLTAAAASNDIGDWTLQDVAVTQTIPAEQPAASDYNIDMVLSVVAS